MLVLTCYSVNDNRFKGFTTGEVYYFNPFFAIMVSFRCRAFLDTSLCAEWVTLCNSEVSLSYLIACFSEREMKTKIDGGMQRT